jgi:carbamoyltransferase
MTKYYIGLANTYHDSAIAIVNDSGRVVFAEGTERYLQNKRAFYCPADQYARIGRLLKAHCSDASHYVVSTSWTTGYNQQVLAMLNGPPPPEGAPPAAPPAPPSAFERTTFTKMAFIYRSQGSAQPAAGLGLQCWLDETGARATVERREFDHHLTHAAAAAYGSPFSEAACAVIDGFGEGNSCNFYRYDGHGIEEITHPSKRPSVPSLGMFYGLLCMMCGFDMHQGEEWKVMGMAPYGRLNPELYQLFDRMALVDGLTLENGDVGSFIGFFEQYEAARLAGKPLLPPADVAFTGQLVYQEKLFALLRNLHEVAGSDQLLLGGGCALNSSANGLISEQTPFRKLFVPSAPADDGNAVGAALLAFHRDHPERTPARRTLSPYLGSTMDPRTLEHVQRFSGLPFTRPTDIARSTAELLAASKIVGWVQGAAEFGPRALGNRSILADPRRAAIKDEINERVKFREEFRPFAPSVLHEQGEEYFVNYQESPYMDRTLAFREEVKQRVAGVVHVNGTGRLQTVKREWNEKYYALIRAFAELTGVPMLLNTSFNVMGKPIVHSVEDALAVFFTSGLDALVIDDSMLLKQDLS